MVISKWRVGTRPKPDNVKLHCGKKNYPILISLFSCIWNRLLRFNLYFLFSLPVPNGHISHITKNDILYIISLLDQSWLLYSINKIYNELDMTLHVPHIIKHCVVHCPVVVDWRHPENVYWVNERCPCMRIAWTSAFMGLLLVAWHLEKNTVVKNYFICSRDCFFAVHLPLLLLNAGYGYQNNTFVSAHCHSGGLS